MDIAPIHVGALHLIVMLFPEDLTHSSSQFVSHEDTNYTKQRGTQEHHFIDNISSPFSVGDFINVRDQDRKACSKFVS